MKNRERFHSAFRATLLLFFLMLLPVSARAVPSYARQLNMPCTGCHVQFPVLNEFGKEFKLSGYTLTAQPTISAEDERKRKILDLPLPALLSVMFQADFTQTAKREPDSKNNNIEFPDQASVFLAGRIAPKVGSFVQLTYSGSENSFGVDNADIRFADQAEVFAKPVMYGVTLNNNPTVTDPYNTIPAWGYPYAASPSAPTPAANTLVNGELAQEVAGATVYGFFDQLVYMEVGVYGSAPLGVDRPLTRDGTISGAAPYWRLALQHTWGQNSFMLGHFGLAAREYPDNDSPKNRFTDLGFDFQYRRPVGPGVFQLQGRYIYERTRWGTGNAENRHTDLHQLGFDATYYWQQLLSFTLAPFATFGTRDSMIYAPESVDGSADGRPDSNGIVAQVSYNPWLNTRLTLQYTTYFKFNGRVDDYDGEGRDAHDNDTLFLQSWLVW
jgi:hypothetical protein